MRLNKELCANDARIQVLQARIWPLEAALVAIEDDPEQYSVSDYMKAQTEHDGKGRRSTRARRTTKGQCREPARPRRSIEGRAGREGFNMGPGRPGNLPAGQ